MQWPVDFNLIEKNSDITQESIECAYSIKYLDDPKRYSFKQMELMSLITHMRPDLLGNVRCLNQGLRIMTDLEADDHLDKRYRIGIYNLISIAQKRGGLDRSEFDEARLAKCASLDGALSATVLTAKAELRKHSRMLAALARPKGELPE